MIKSLDVSQWAPAKNLAFFAPPAVRPDWSCGSDPKDSNLNI
jgi:hypothetical protein